MDIAWLIQKNTNSNALRALTCLSKYIHISAKPCVLSLDAIVSNRTQLVCVILSLSQRPSERRLLDLVVQRRLPHQPLPPRRLSHLQGPSITHARRPLHYIFR